MTQPTTPLAITAADTTPRQKSSGYPEPFRSRVAGREKRPLGDVFGLKNFGVNLTTLRPGSESALLHRHSRQDEFIYIVSGEAVLVTDQGEIAMTAGMCAGFPAAGLAHQLVNRSAGDVTYLEIGDRTPGDAGIFPNDDIRADLDDDGRWFFSRKSGARY
jgi:uncharacterized cupin superfamily protein